MFSRKLVLLLVLLFAFSMANSDTTQVSQPAKADTTWLDKPQRSWRVKTPGGWGYIKAVPIHDASGVPYEEARGQKNSPQIVTDTVRCSNGFGVLDLNAQRGRGKLSVVPSSSDDIHVFGIIPIITDSTQAVPSYGAWINRELDQLNIQSSDTSDTRLVQVSFMVQ